MIPSISPDSPAVRKNNLNFAYPITSKYNDYYLKLHSIILFIALNEQHVLIFRGYIYIWRQSFLKVIFSVQQLAVRMNLYRLIYLFQGLWMMFVGSFLPIYLTIVHHYATSAFALLVLLGQSPLILKPLFGILADKYPMVKSPRRAWLLIGSLFLIGGTLGVTLDISLVALATFIGFFTITFLGYAICNVFITGIVLDLDRKRNYVISGNFQFFVQVGSLLMNGAYVLIIQGNPANRHVGDFTVFRDCGGNGAAGLKYTIPGRCRTQTR